MTPQAPTLVARPLRRPRPAWSWLGTGSVALAALMGAGPAWAQSADLVLAQHVVTPDPLPAGGIATVTMTVQNNGTGTASNVTLTDTIPPGATFVSMTASDGGTCSTAVPYNCTWGSIPFPGSRTVTLRLTLPTATVYTNTAEVASATPDPNTDNNRLVRNITVQAAADLRVTASSTALPGDAAGKPFSYAVTVSNGGPDPLPVGQNPTVSFRVPAGASITGTPAGSGWSCTPNSGWPRSNPPSPGAEIICTRNDALATGASFPPITVPAVSNVTGTVTAAFGVGSSYLDGDLTNNATTVDASFGAGTDMGITKAFSLAAAGGGTQATFTLTARQVAGSPPTNVTVTDTLPAGMAYVSHSAPAPWACNWTAPLLSCTYPGTWSGGPASSLPAITLVANVTGSGAIPNTGIVSSDQADPVPGNNTHTVTVDNSADLRITKTPSISPVTLNQPYNWTVTVRNWGPQAILAGQTLTVTDTLPAGMELTAAPTGSGWSCSPTSGSGPLVVTCTRAGPLAANASAPAITFPVRNTAAGALTNNACVALGGAGPADSVPGNNCVGAGNTGTTQQADLSIAKTVSAPRTVVGQPLAYTLTVSNSGPDVATNVIVNDVLNNLLNTGGLQSASASQGTCSPAGPANGTSQNVSCNVGTLAVGGSATVTLTILPANTGATDLTRNNTATVNSIDVGDPNRGNNSDTVSSIVEPRVDMTVNKSVTPNPVRVGEPMVYVVTARNAGPSAARNVRISDPMPPNTAFIGVDSVSNSGTCGTVPAPGSTGGTLECAWPANLNAGAQYTATFRVRPLAAALDTDVINTVTVATDSTETNLDNNSGSAQARVIAADLDILVQKTDSVDPVPLGGETEYTITITNVGPSYGTNLVMTDTFPNAGATARFSYQGGLSTSVPGTCTEPATGATSGTLECRFPTLAPGSGSAITVKYRMRAESIVTAGDYSGTQGNHVAVRVDETEREMTNNATDEDTTTRRDAIATDLALAKAIDKTQLKPGEQAVYTLTVTNHGPLASIGAQIVDVLPAGLSFVSSAGGCVDSAGTVSCAVGALPSGGSRTFSFTVQLASPYTGPSRLVNTAKLDAPGDTDPSNNEGSAETRVPGELMPVPTLGEWSLLLLGLLAAGLGARRLRQRP